MCRFSPDTTLIYVNQAYCRYFGKDREAAIRDITERKRAEEELRQSERRFRPLIQNASDIITVLDADGTVRYNSPAVERILGYVEEELVGTRVFDYIHPDDLEDVKRTFAEALESSRVHPPLQFPVSTCGRLLALL